MKRIALFEFEDFPCLPSVIREGITNLIVVFHRLLKTPEVLANLLEQVHRQHPFTQITDLGSGSGGAMPAALQALKEARPSASWQLLLTDLHPSPPVVAKFNASDSNTVRYHPEPMDATQLQGARRGIRTMIASFHHIPPATARQILAAAQDSGEPFLIYELAKNNIPTLLWWLFLPLSLAILVLMSLVMTLFVRPLTLSQLLFTYLIPIIPLIYAWDGQASLMRTYTFADFQELLPPDSAAYSWTIADAQRPDGKTAGYYVLGLPTASQAQEPES
jgi:hypothetical protein